MVRPSKPSDKQKERVLTPTKEEFNGVFKALSKAFLLVLQLSLTVETHIYRRFTHYCFRQRDPVFECLLELKSVTHDTGEFIFATMLDAFYVLYYDPKRERAKWIEHEGIGDQEFWIRNGLLRGTYYSVDWFPNHSESLMSLDNVPCSVAGGPTWSLGPVGSPRLN
ncbi:unnamed protein product [Brassica napus]|uniref:(rape) hypothetical protein n=1 Tax=Brassica napus TaxID=3708 RepID=A0A817ATP5_BRANA|nr:unnamed protein product [Brassica napus]